MIHNKGCLIALAAAAVFAQGCSTHLNVQSLSEKSIAPAQGAQYSLPFTRYKIAVTRILTACGAPGEHRLEFDTTVTADQMFEPDPSQTFVIDTTSLSNWLKTSELSWELYENGMLKSVGASAEDITGQVISGTVSLALSIARPAGVRIAKPPSACTDQIRDAIQEVIDKRTALKQATKALDLEAGRLKAMTDVIAPFGEAPSRVVQTRVIDQAALVSDKRIEVVDAEKAMKNALRRITTVETFVWPDDGRRMAEKRVLSSTQFSGWLNDQVKLQDVDLNLRIVPLNNVSIANERATHLPASAVGVDLDGIRYRVPVKGALIASLCSTIVAQASRSRCPDEEMLDERVVEGPVPQLGRIFAIPFWNGPFQKNTLNLAFSEDGAMTSGKYAELAARGQVAIDSLNQAADNLLTGLKDIKDLRVSRSQKELQDVKAQTELLQAKKQLQDATTALQPGSTAQNDKEKALILSDTELLDAQRAKIEAQLALDAAKAKAQPTTP